MREPGFYWVKYHEKWLIAECTKWWPTISDGSYEHRWFVPGFRKGRRDSDMDEIDERRLVFNEFEFEIWKYGKEIRKRYTDISCK